jgi:HEAT repeat protein
MALLAERPDTQRTNSRTSIAAHVLGDIGADAKEAVPALAGVVAFGQQGAPQEAAEALGKIGPPARSAEPALLKALDTTLDTHDGFFRVIVAKALVQIGCQSAGPVWALVDVVMEPSEFPFYKEASSAESVGAFRLG